MSKKKPKKRTIEDTQTEFMKACTTVLNSQKPLTEFDLIGMSIAKKLERMDPTQALYAESIINSVLLKGLKKQLREDTDLCTNSCNTLRQVTYIATPTTSSQYITTPSPYSQYVQTPTPSPQHGQSTSTSDVSQSALSPQLNIHSGDIDENSHLRSFYENVDY